MEDNLLPPLGEHTKEEEAQRDLEQCSRQDVEDLAQLNELRRSVEYKASFLRLTYDQSQVSILFAEQLALATSHGDGQDEGAVRGEEQLLKSAYVDHQ